MSAVWLTKTHPWEVRLLVKILLPDGVHEAAPGVWRGQLHALPGELLVEVPGVRLADHLGLEGRSDPLLLQV